MLATTAALASAACGSEPMGLVGGGGADAGAPCAEGAARPCGLEIGTHGASVTCAMGNQLCVAGKWTSCFPDAALGTRVVPAPGTTRLEQGQLGLQTVGGSATQCANSPCDPTCQRFTDVPDSAITSAPTPSVTTLGIGILAQSNVPAAFQTRGSDPNKVCTPGCNSVACEQACQYGQRCSTTQNKACQAFGLTESGACTGVDITAGVGCGATDGSMHMFVCNRGTVDAPPGVICWLLPGNSQQMPSATPDMSHATKAGTTVTTLQPGACERVEIAEHENGIQEAICNVPNTELVAGTKGPNYPTSEADVAGDGTWGTPAGAYSTGGSYATVASSARGTNAVSYGGFGFGIPATATITKITATASWRLSSSAVRITFGLQAHNGATALGTMTTDASKPTSFVTVTQVVSGAALGGITPADLNGTNFQVQAQVTR